MKIIRQKDGKSFICSGQVYVLIVGDENFLSQWKESSVFQVSQDSSNSDHAQSNKCQVSVMLFVDWV